MAAFEDIFSEGYLDEFYKTHVASRRTSIDDDIAAIEAEITKVHQYRRKFRRYRVDDQQLLNSCGNSECSDDDSELYDTNIDMEMLPTSVFKVFNSTSSNGHAPTDCVSSSGNVFNWAQYQIISHDHNYSSGQQQEPFAYLVHEGLNLDHVQWNQLTATKRLQALKRLASILRNRPNSSQPLSPYSSSLTLLPHSLVEILRSNNGVVSKPSNKVVDKKADKNDESTLSLKTTPTLSKTKRRTRSSPYDRKMRSIEITRIRNSSTCSETDTLLEVD